uniref:FH2 domain-containing protein n=1 Tax=Aegilops tauschii subsp. strangulata TaxID=200361 RepID=A0A453PW55_AEGTS
MPSTDAKRTRQRPPVASKQEKVHLIDLQRSKNCEIMLRNIKMPLPDLMASVLTLDDSIVDGDQVDYLIKFCPTKEEMELLKSYTGSKENLGKCEQVADVKNNLNTINDVAEEVRNSDKLKRVMQTILSLGNALNQGTARGESANPVVQGLFAASPTAVTKTAVCSFSKEKDCCFSYSSCRQAS